MASRENQGLQVALILLVMLSIGLCVTTFVFYSKSSTRLAEAEEAKSRMKTAENERDQSNYANQMLTYMINSGAETWTQMAEQLDSYPVGDNPELAQIRTTFKQDMLLFGGPDEPYEKARNYQTLPDFLMQRVRDLNQQLTDLRQSENQLTAQMAQLEQAAAERTQQFEQAQKKANDDLIAERKKFNEDRDRLEQEKLALATRLTEKDNQLAEFQADMDALKQGFQKQVNDLEKIVAEQRNQINLTDRQSFEVADAEITSVNQSEGVAYINVGSADNLRREQTFSVYDKRQTGVMQATPKGRIEVTEVLRDHLAACRILEDDLADIIVSGDVVFTPAWSPGQKVHFAMAGLIDISGNGRSDAKLLTDLIQANGGVIDEEVTPQTRYLIRGADKSGVAGSPELTNEQRAEYNQKIRSAQQIGVDQLSVDRLLALMGWRPKIEAVSFRDEGLPAETEQADEEADEAFRRRTPPRGQNGAF